MRGTNRYLSFVGKRIKTLFLYFFYRLLYPDVLSVKVQVFLYSRKSKFQSIWDANGMQIMHEPYFINLKHFSMKIRQHIHPCCCRVVYSSMFSADEHVQNRTLLELLSTACLQTSLKSMILWSLFSCISYFVSLWEIVFWTYLHNLLDFCNLYSFAKEDYPLSEQATVNWFQEQILLALKTEMIRPLVIKVPRSSHQIWLITSSNGFSMLIKVHSNIQNHLWSWHSKPALMAPDKQKCIL